MVKPERYQRYLILFCNQNRRVPPKSSQHTRMVPVKCASRGWRATTASCSLCHWRRSLLC